VFIGAAGRLNMTESASLTTQSEKAVKKAWKLLLETLLPKEQHQNLYRK
jgi:hypothetical protein